MHALKCLRQVFIYHKGSLPKFVFLRNNSFLCSVKKRWSMDNIKSIIVLLFFWLAAGCTSSEIQKEVSLINQAESLLQSDPHQAHALLDSVKYPGDLSDKDLTKWCLSFGKLADSIHTELPWSYYLERSWEYSHKKKLPECATIGLYLGRSYMEEKDVEKAMKVYLQALDIALQRKDYNLAGYISSYSADVYEFQYDYLLAKDKYLQAADYFKQAGNKRSEGLALAEVGKMYIFSDSIDAGLQQILNSKRIFESINNKRCISLSYNHIGNVYMYLKKYDLAEEHFLKSIEIGDDENSSSYLALAGVYTNLSQWEKALDCLEKAKKPSLNKNVQNDIFYHYYLIYNAQGKYKEAVSYLDKYVDLIAGSTKTRNKSKVASIENRYRQSKYQMDNIQLKADKAQLKLLGVLGLLLIVIVFAYFRSRFSKKIYHQRLELERKNVSLSKLQGNLEAYKEKIRSTFQASEDDLDNPNIYLDKIDEMILITQQIKEQRILLFKKSEIVKLITKLSYNVKAQSNEKQLSDSIWIDIISIIELAFPSVVKKCEEVKFTPTEKVLCYLSLFNLGTSGEATLLGVSNDAVNKHRQRIRKKLNLTDRNLGLFQYFCKL